MHYQQEYIRCGKRCGSCPHGPYWYAYWKDYRGVTRKQYIGKQLPDDTRVVPRSLPVDQWTNTSDNQFAP